MSEKDEMLELLLAQFYERPVIKALVEVICEEFDAHTQLKADLREKTWPATAVGKQLDMCGEVADISRTVEGTVSVDYFGFPEHGNNSFGKARFYRYGESYLGSAVLQDNEYRLAIMSKIAKNTTDGSRQSTIDSIKRMFQVSRVMLINAGNAKIRAGIGRVVTKSELDLINGLDLIIRGAGIGLVYFFYFNDGKTFGFTRKGNNLGNFAPMGEGTFARVLQIEGSIV